MEIKYSNSLKINKLTQAQFNATKTAGNIESDALYLTPEQPLVITINNGTTEGTNKFTYDGSVAKTVNISTGSSSDTKVTQAATITANGNYPVILGYNTNTTSVTNSVNKASTLVFNPNTGTLCVGNPAVLTSTSGSAGSGTLYVNGNIYAGGGSDDYGIYPRRDNYSEVGAQTQAWYKVHSYNVYANNYYVGAVGEDNEGGEPESLVDYLRSALSVTDEKCAYTSVPSYTSAYPLLAKSSTSTTVTAGKPYFVSTVTLTPKTGTITATTFNATSDKRLKKNIKEFKPQKSILDLPVVEFDFKESAAHQIGCLAQDLQEICPEIVHEDEAGYLSISEGKIVYLLIDEVKKLKAEVEELKTKV